MADTLERYLKDLEDQDKSVTSSGLANLSGLTGAELARFQQGWARLKLERRRQVAAKLAESAQDNQQLDFDGVFRVCLDDPDREVRLLALDGLEGSESQFVLTPLIARLRGDGEEAVRVRAASVLGGFVLQAELGQLSPRDASRVQEALLTIVQEAREPLEVRRRAVESLGPLSQEPVLQVIREAYASPDPRMRASALYAMGRNCDPGWLPLLITESRSSLPELRYEAARAMGEIEDAAALPSLLSLLRDPEREVQLAAIAALGHLDGRPARQALRDLRHHADPVLREAAAAALEEQSLWEEPLSFG